MHRRIVIRPASIENPDGSFEHVFPGKSEEDMEEALKLLFKDQNHGFHDANPRGQGTWVAFSWPLLRAKLALLKATASQAQMKRSINIMENTRIELFAKGAKTALYSENILPTFISVSRDQYREDSDKMQMVRLPTAMTSAINTLGYRQFNSKRLSDFKKQMTAYLYRRLINKFTYASVSDADKHNFTFKDIKQHSNLCEFDSDTDNRKLVKGCLQELVDSDVIMTPTFKNTKAGNKIVDVKYTVVAHPTFAREQKQANARHQDNLTAAKQEKLLLVDNNGTG